MKIGFSHFTVTHLAALRASVVVVISARSEKFSFHLGSQALPFYLARYLDVCPPASKRRALTKNTFLEQARTTLSEDQSALTQPVVDNTATPLKQKHPL